MHNIYYIYTFEAYRLNISGICATTSGKRNTLCRSLGRHKCKYCTFV